jgi:hypothetical protein
MRKPSRHTLLGRVHEQASLEEQRDAEGLYQLIDPTIRARREQVRSDEPGLTLSELEEFARWVEAADVKHVEILEARKASKRHGNRPAALVRSVIRYNHRSEPQEFRTIWVRDSGIWYTTALCKRRSPPP